MDYMANRIECYRCGKTHGVFHKHHIYRKRNGSKVVNLCPECHAWVHSNPKEAEKLGLYEKLQSIKYIGGTYFKKEDND